MSDGSDGTPVSVLSQISRDVAVIRLSRPAVLNALSPEMREDLVSLVRRFDADPHIRGIVITGTGRAFSAGADLSAAKAETPEDSLAGVESFHEITRAILGTRKPVVAAINGLAVGGAAELTLCCDARIGGEDAEFFMPENSIGLAISNASSLLLRRLVGNHATRIVLASPRVKADEAERIGLLDKVVSEDRLIEEAIDVVWEWTPEAGGTSVHLKLLRPLAAEVEAAFQRENEATAAMWRAGITNTGIDRFWRQKAHTA